MKHPFVRLRPLAALVLLVLAVAAYAGSVDVQPSRVQGLHYSMANADQEATFTFSYTPPSGLGVMFIGWYLDGTELQAYHSQTSASATVVGPGKHSMECRVYAYQSSGGYFNESIVKSFAAIGGPIFLTADLLHTAESTFTHDQRDYDKPVYAQYFDYSHASPPTDARLQLTQDAYASVGGQPDGTSMVWEYGSMYCPDLVGQFSTTLTGIRLQAESPGITTVKCLFTYDDPVEHFSGFAYDDTDETPIDPSYPNVTMVNKVDAHRPTSTSIVQVIPFQTVAPNGAYYINPAGDPQNNVPPPLPSLNWQNGEWGYGTLDTLLLMDQDGENMPGVWVQERFTSNAPAHINNDSMFWVSQMPPYVSGINVPWDFPPSGFFGIDEFSIYTYANPQNYTMTPNDAVHHYWAATKVVTPPPPGGIDVGTYTIHYVAPPSYPNQQPGGTP